MPFQQYSNKYRKTGSFNNSEYNTIKYTFGWESEVHLCGYTGGFTLLYYNGGSAIAAGVSGRITIYPNGWGQPKVVHEHGEGTPPTIVATGGNGSFEVKIKFTNGGSVYYEGEMRNVATFTIIKE